VDRQCPAFVSQARADSAFAQRLAADLKTNGAHVWLDQLGIRPGRQWDREVELALATTNEMLVILSPTAVDSTNVMDEVAYALEEHKVVIPVLLADCRIPFRLRSYQYIDFRSDYQASLQTLLSVLALDKPATPEAVKEVVDTAPKIGEDARAAAAAVAEEPPPPLSKPEAQKP
jgi:hypothetical protein